MFRVISILASVPVVCALLTCPAEADEPTASRPAATQPSAKPTYTIGHTWRIGQKRTLLLHTQREFEREHTQGVPVHSKFDLRMYLELEVSEGEVPGEEKSVRLTIRRVRGRRERSDEEGSIRIDTNKPETIGVSDQEVLAVVGVSFRAGLNAEGAITRFEGADGFVAQMNAPISDPELRDRLESSVRRMFRSCLQTTTFPMPPRAVAVGDTWEVQSAPLLKATIFSDPAKPLPDIECKLKRVEKTKAGAVAIIGLRNADSVGDQAGPGGLEGEARYNMDRREFAEYSRAESQHQLHGMSNYKARVTIMLIPELGKDAATRPAPTTQPATAPAGGGVATPAGG